MRPLIGLTTSELRVREDPRRREMVLGLTYFTAIEAAGGLPVVMPPLGLDTVDPLLDGLAGICLSGGPDLDPATYGDDPHPALGPTEPELDRFELEVIRRADERGMPLLAICRGAEAVNAARGGTLHQHLPDRPGARLEHRQRAGGDRLTHPVEIARGSLLGRVMRRRRARVNSFHHQAVARLGSGLRATAWAPDGVIEGIEAPGRKFLLGVQWHAEALVTRREHAALFSALVDAASNHALWSGRAHAA